MCSQSDDPTQYDTPTFTKPRTYVLAGDVPRVEEPKPSVALAVIGDMLEAAEDPATHFDNSYGRTEQLRVLREARDRIAQAEAAQ